MKDASGAVLPGVIQGNLDVFNVANSSTVLAVNQTYGTTWLQPTQIMPGRMLKLGFQMDF